MPSPPETALVRASVVLLVEDDPSHVELARRALDGREGLQFNVVESLGSARLWLQSRAVDLVLADLRLPDGSGMDLLAPGLPLVVLTSQGDEARAVAAMKGGALDYVVKSPELYRDLPVVIERALRTARSEVSQKRAEQMLRESETRFRQLAASIQEAFWLQDLASDRLLYTSPAFDQVYGVTGHPSPSTGDRLGAVHPEDLARVVAARQPGPSGEANELEYRVVDGNKVRWIHERTFPVFDEVGVVVGLAGLGGDITRRRELEMALRQSQKMEAIGQLAGGVAHDFNNMLAAILSAGEQLLESQHDPDDRELCALIVSASERAADLTRKLLAFARKGKARSTPVDVHAVIRDAVALLERSIDRRVTITTELGAESAFVLGDVGQLQSALLNLGINARDAMPDGGRLCFRTELEELDESTCETLPYALQPGKFLKVSVHDDGGGIPADVLGRVFEPFFTLKEPGKGTGLGLAAVHGTVVEHHGAATVTSVLGQGSVFELHLPLTLARKAPGRTEGEAAKGQGLVLLVDDEPLLLTAGARLLASLGFGVITASDGEEALEKFAAVMSDLVAVVSDVAMPRLDGLGMLVRMKALRPSIPVVLTSGFPRDHEGFGATIEPDAFVQKPFRRAELAATLLKLLEPGQSVDTPTPPAPGTSST